MNITLVGALVGTAVAVTLLLAEYLALRAAAAERVKGRRGRIGLNVSERAQFASVARFCVLLPPAFAGAFWLFPN